MTHSIDRNDPFDVARLYKYLRVTDVADAMDGIGYFDIGLMDREVRPLWLGMKFWGPALTFRCVPANRPMWKLNTTEEIVHDHAAWYDVVKTPLNIGAVGRLVQPGHVIVQDCAESPETGYWGSNSAMAMIANGAVGIVTDGECRDTYEVCLQKTPVCCRGYARTIIPGRTMEVEAQVPIGCGGVRVDAGDMVGCDDDGVIVVPQDVAAEVAEHARAVLLADMQSRKRLYEQLGLPKDETVDIETVEAYYARFSQ